MTSSEISHQGAAAQASPPAFRDLARVFGRIGLLSFGGPAAQISLMHRELVEDRAWLSEPSFLRALSLCMLLPGPEAMQLATYAGWHLRGVAGGVLAGALFVVPGALIIAALLMVYVTWGDVPLVQAAFLGIKSAVIVVVLAALRGLSKRALNSGFDWCLAVAAFLAIYLFAVPFPVIIAVAALLGFWRVSRPTGSYPTPNGATARGSLRTGLVWGAAWLLPLLGLSAMGAGVLAQIGWFFAWLAVVSFGGAYALLAYMSQTVVSEFGWITTPQMIDALGLAETTPGPLILVTQFVAMLTGYGDGGMALALAAGAVALWATFLPCFLFIFAAAPHVERLAQTPRLSGALSAVTAAVTGVILNLSVWFALNVFFSDMTQAPELFPALMLPVPGSLNISAAVLFLIAAVLVFWGKQGLPVVLGLSALAGVLIGALAP